MTSESISDFKNSLRGKLVQRNEPGYEDARKVYNGMINKHPAMIAYCADIADVIQCVNFARENKILLAIRSGGHNAGGLGIADEAFVIDLSPMKGIYVDPVRKSHGYKRDVC